MVLVEAHFQEDFVFLTFSSAIDITLTQPRKTAFKINVEGRSHIGIKSILYPADLTEPNIATVVIETTHDLRPGDVVRLSYTKPSTNPLTDTFGVEADGFTNVLARNTIPAKEPDAPPNFRANSGAVDGSVSLTWDEAWWNGSAITRYEVRVDNGSWRTVPGGGSARSHTVTGLVVGSERTFRVRAVNGEGSSEASSVTFTVTESKLEFTLTLIEEGIWRGGPATTAVLAIKGHHYWNRLPEPITFDLTWNGNPVNEAPLHPDNPTSMTIPAGEHLARVELRAAADSDGADRVYNRPVTHRLVATSSDGVFVVENRSPSKGPRGLTIVDNEKKPRVSLQGPEIVDEGEHFRLTVRFSHRLDQDAEIRGSVINGARHSWNLTGIRDSFGLTIPKGELTATSGQIRKPQNTRKDGDKTVTFLVKQPGDNPWLGTPLHEVRINDDETPDADRWQRLSVDDASVHESGDGSDTQMRFNVSLRDARSQQPTVTVEYRTVDGTATAGSDYTATSGTLTFAPGEKRKQVLVPVKDDPIDDDGETFELVLENPTDARLDPERSRATGTIHNNGAPRLSATFPSSAFASRSHTGADDRPQVIVEFSEAVAAFGENTPSVSVGNGAVETVQAHTEDGLDHAYVFFLAPDGDEDVRFTLVPNAACGAGGICTTAGLELGDVPGARTIPGPEDSDPSDASVLSVNDAEASEENDSTIDFVVELDPASSESVTVDYETADGTAGAGDDYTAKSGTLTFSPGDTRKTVSVPIVDDAVEDDNETLTLTLGNASGAEIDDAEATGTIRDDDQAASTPLTASFRNMPAEHDGDAAFSFEVEFSEDVGTSYRTLRDDSFTVTNGDVTGARRVDGRHDLWEITVEPDSDEAVTITLPGDRECGTTGAVCTRGDDPQPLSNSPSATVAGPEEPAQTNTEAAGAPTISGTAQVDKTLTASVSDISDADGLDDASFDYQWVRGSADIAGATDSSYTLVSADEGERIKVRVSFTDDAGNAESLTSAATDAVAAAPQPLTASFSGMPAEHDGSTEFTFELHFSEDVKAGYERIRDDAFSISGGNINQARRQTQGSNQSWEIKVRPSGGDRITITLPETTSCSSTGAICTEDGRKLSHSTADSVSGPVGISVGDARVQEGEGAFPISRSRAHTHRRHGHPLQTVPSAGLIERPQEKNRVDALR